MAPRKLKKRPAVGIRGGKRGARYVAAQFIETRVRDPRGGEHGCAAEPVLRVSTCA
jgi:hypothetical protein